MGNFHDADRGPGPEHVAPQTLAQEVELLRNALVDVMKSVHELSDRVPQHGGMTEAQCSEIKEMLDSISDRLGNIEVYADHREVHY